MAQGMSEGEVKKKLYGEFAGASKDADADKGRPKAVVTKKSISIKPAKKFFPIKSISIIGIVFLVLLSIVIIGVTKSRSKTEPLALTEAEQIKGYLAQGKKYYKDGLFDEAILTWKNIIAIDSNHRTTLRYIRRAELKKKELKIREEETAQKLKEMLAQREKEEKEKILQIEIRQLVKEGDTCFRKEDFSQAIAAYERVLSISPGNYRAVKNIERAQKKIASEKKKIEIAKEPEKPQEEIVPREIKKGPLYTVQVATYLDSARAEELAKKLAQKGFVRLSVKEVSAKSGRVLYEVHLGTFRNKKDAAQEVEKIKKEGFKDSFIKLK